MSAAVASEPFVSNAPVSFPGAEESLEASEPRKPAVLVLGLGNDILTDDAVGLVAASQLRSRFTGHPDIAVIESQELGLGLLDQIVGHRDLVVIDSVQTGRVPAGHLHEVDEAHINTLPGMSPHFLGVGEILALGRLMGQPMPERVCLFAVEAEDSHTLGTELSDSVALALPGVVARVTARITEWSEGSATI